MPTARRFCLLLAADQRGVRSRVFWQKLKIEKGTKSVGRGEPDTVSFSVVQRAKTHNLGRTTLEILVSSDFEALNFEPPPKTSAVKTVEGVESRMLFVGIPSNAGRDEVQQGVELRLAG